MTRRDLLQVAWRGDNDGARRFSARPPAGYERYTITGTMQIVDGHPTTLELIRNSATLGLEPSAVVAAPAMTATSCTRWRSPAPADSSTLPWPPCLALEAMAHARREGLIYEDDEGDAT